MWASEECSSYCLASSRPSHGVQHHVCHTTHPHSLHGPPDNSSERRSIQIFQMSRILLQNFNILPLKVGSCEVGVPVLSRNEVTGILIRTGATEQLSLSLSEKQFPVWAPQIVEVRGEEWGPAHTFLIIICRLDFSSPPAHHHHDASRTSARTFIIRIVDPEKHRIITGVCISVYATTFPW